MIDQGDSELDSVLRDLFPLAGSKGQGGRARVRLPGVKTHGSGPRGGGSGGGGGATPAPEIPETAISLGDQPIEAVRRLLSNLMLHSAAPPHNAPPFMSEPLDIFPTAAVSMPGGGYGAGAVTDIISYTVPENFKAVFIYAGQLAESAAAYQDIQWQIAIDDKGYRTYSNIRSQLFQQAPTGTTIFIPVRGGQTIKMKGNSLSSTSYNVWARLQGWQWPTRYDEGESASGSMVG